MLFPRKWEKKKEPSSGIDATCANKALLSLFCFTSDSRGMKEKMEKRDKTERGAMRKTEKDLKKHQKEAALSDCSSMQSELQPPKELREHKDEKVRGTESQLHGARCFPRSSFCVMVLYHRMPHARTRRCILPEQWPTELAPPDACAKTSAHTALKVFTVLYIASVVMGFKRWAEARSHRVTAPNIACHVAVARVRPPPCSRGLRASLPPPQEEMRVDGTSRTMAQSDKQRKLGAQGKLGRDTIGQRACLLRGFGAGASHSLILTLSLTHSLVHLLTHSLSRSFFAHRMVVVKV